MITVENLHKSFSDKKVLENINAIFEPGSVSTVIGPSGCGKTTLLKCMLGLSEPDRGKVLFGNKNFSSMNFQERKGIRKNIGMLFQNGALFDSMNVRDNILFPLHLNFPTLSKQEKLDMAYVALERVGLSDVGNLLPSELSGGMRKRVGIARAIVLKPKYLFVDEPNSGLDPQNSLLIDKLILELTLTLNITTVVITHDMNSVLEIGNNVYFLHNSIVEWKGTKKNILETENEPLKRFFFANKLFGMLKK